jgi:hypothetical protein
MPKQFWSVIDTVNIRWALVLPAKCTMAAAFLRCEGGVTGDECTDQRLG